MNIDEKIKHLLQQTITEKDKQKRMFIFNEILALNEYAIYFYGKNYDELRMKYYRKEDYYYSSKQTKKNQTIFLNSFNLERDYHQIFSGFTISSYYDSTLKYRKFYLKETMSKKQFFQILFDFFENELPEFYPFLLKMFEENRIFFSNNSNLLQKESIGLTRYLPFSKKSVIFLPKEYTLKNLITLIHEVGHAIHFEYIKDNYVSLSAGYFSEIFSYFFEQIFIDYLKQNNLFKEEVNRYLDSLSILLFNKANELYILSNLSHFSVDSVYNVQTSREEIYEEMKDHLSNDMTPSKLKQLNLRNTLLYYYGILFSYELLEKYQENPKQTLKKLKNVLSSKEIIFLNDILSIVQIDLESLISNKTLQKQINHIF